MTPLQQRVRDLVEASRQPAGSPQIPYTCALSIAKIAVIQEMLDDPAFRGGERTALAKILEVR